MFTTKPLLKLNIFLFLIFVSSAALCGQEWIQQSPWPADDDLYDVEVLSANEAWIVGFDQIVMQTNDGGVTWAQHSDFPRSPFFQEDALRRIQFVNDTTAFIGGNNIFRSDDEGQNWIDMGFHGQVEEMQFLNPTLGFISTNGGLRRTTDGSQTFQTVHDRISGLSFLNENLGLITEDGNILQTNDGGGSFSQISSFGIRSVLMVDEQIVIGSGINTTGLANIYRSDDGGVTWALVLQTSSNFPHMTRIEGDSLAVVDSANGVFISHDVGLTWLPTQPVVGAWGSLSPLFSRIDFAPDGQIGFTSGHGGIIQKTSSGGNSWSQLSRGIARDLNDVVMLPSGRGIAVGAENTILRTTNFGNHWQAFKPIINTSQELHAVQAISDDVFFAGGTEGAFYRSDDGGLTWTLLGQNFFGGNVAIFEIAFVNENEGWVFGQSNAPNGLIAHTTDSGVNWELLYNEVGIPRDAQMFDADNGIAVVSDFDFQMLTDTGFATFAGQSLPNVAGSWVAMQYVTPQIGWYGALHGDVLRTDNGGLIFEQQTLPGFIVSGGLPNDRLSDIATLSTEHALIATRRQGSGVSRGIIYETMDGGDSWAAMNQIVAPDNERGGTLQAIDVLPSGEIWTVSLNGYVFASGTSVTLDSDSDLVDDSIDNCILISNPDQRDTNGDGFGNACDPDLDNNGIVNFSDVALWVPFFNTATTGDADFNGDGFANFGDYALYLTYFLQSPGPSGIAP